MSAGRGAFAILGLLLVASQIALTWLAPEFAVGRPEEIAQVLPLIGLLSIPAALLLLTAPSLARLEVTRRRALLVLACGLGMRLVWLGTPAPLEDDFNRYLWDGALVAHGENPYALAPRAVIDGAAATPGVRALAGPGAATLSRINFPDLRTIYPGTAELIFALAHVLAPFSIDGLRLVFIAADLVALALIVAPLRASGGAPALGALYWLNPLVVFTTTATAHVDGVMVPMLLGAALLVRRGRGVASLALLALAAGIKVWPLLLAPLLLVETARRGGRVIRAAATFAILGLALQAPLIASVSAPASGLAAFATSWSNNNGPYAWTSYALYLVFGDSTAAQAALRLALAAAAGMIALVVARRRDTAADAPLAAMTTLAAAVFYLSPAQFPWYALPLLALATVTGNRPLLFASVTLPAYYLFFPLWESDDDDLFQYGWAFLHAVPVWLWLAWENRLFFSPRGAHGRTTGEGERGYV